MASLLPRAILHIDGDSFFAACEQSRNPALRGKPVVTGKERGIASSMSQEAKLRGVTRAMSIREIKMICPDAIFIPSDYETYSLLSRRFYAIVRRFAGEVEEYGIDECFAEITGMDQVLKASYEEIALRIQETLRDELGVTFSVGLGPNKLLAKVGSKWKKPYGFTAIDMHSLDDTLRALPVGKLWGIGHRTARALGARGIVTAFDFKLKSKTWVQNALSKPFYELWRELHGEFVWPLHSETKQSYQSIQKVKTFTPPSQNRTFIFSHLSKNIEAACMKARKYQLTTKEVYIYLRTQDFRDSWHKITLPQHTAFPHEIIRACQAEFGKTFSGLEQYRATGIMLAKLQRDPFAQRDIFGDYKNHEETMRLYEGVDAMRDKYGKYSIFLGSSLQAKSVARHSNERGMAPIRTHELFRGETVRKRLNIPMFSGVVR